MCVYFQNPVTYTSLLTVMSTQQYLNFILRHSLLEIFTQSSSSAADATFTAKIILNDRELRVHTHKKAKAKARMRSCEGEVAIVEQLLPFATPHSRLCIFALWLLHVRNFALTHLRSEGESSKARVTPSEHHTVVVP